MTNKNEEVIEVNLASGWGHWEEPRETEWNYEEASSGILFFHVDSRPENIETYEGIFREKHAHLFSRLADQGIEVMILPSIRQTGDLGVRVEYISLE